MKRTKREAQREQTFQNIIETAEVLFAEHGISAVSLRQIGIEAGSLNTNAVGYYVGTKEDLIEAIFKYRLPLLERWRSDYLEELDRCGLGMDLKALLKATWIPLYNLKDKNGRHSYARLLLNVDRAGLGAKRTALDGDYPAAFEVFRRINLSLNHDNSTYTRYLLRMQLMIVVGTLDFIDDENLDQTEADNLFSESMNMLHAALMKRSAGRSQPDDVSI